MTLATSNGDKTIDTNSGNLLYTVPVFDSSSGEISATPAIALSNLGDPNSLSAGSGITIAYYANQSGVAVKALADAQKTIKEFDKAVETWKEAVAQKDALKDAAKDVAEAGKAVAEVEEAFEELGYNLVKADEGVADGAIYNADDEEQSPDLFVYGGSKLTVENFDGDDLFYFGSNAADIIVVDSLSGPLGGEQGVLDIFAYQNGANTVLFVEKEAFAGNASGNATENPDLVEITLAGVKAEDLVFQDGFLTLA